MVRREEYDAAEATLREQRPEQIANADVVAAAKLVARLPFVTSDAGAIEALLLLVQPFLLSLFCEVGAIVGFSIGLGPGRRRVAESISTPESPERVAGKLSDKDFQAANIASNADRAESDVEAVFAVLRRLGRPANNAELAHGGQSRRSVQAGEGLRRRDRQSAGRTGRRHLAAAAPALTGDIEPRYRKRLPGLFHWYPEPHCTRPAT